MRISVTSMAIAVLVLLAGSEAAAVGGRSPQDALARLKRAVASGDRAGEWALLSPAFKRRLNRKAGRVVDLGDYSAIREIQRGDGQIREAEGALRNARVKKVRYDGRGFARVTLRVGGFVGQYIEVGMVHHAHWELRVKGEPDPYWGFAGDKSIRAVRGKDGSYTVSTHDEKGKVVWKETFPKKKVVSFQRTSSWYFNSLGAVEDQLFPVRQ